MESEVKALSKAGYEVELFAARTDELDGDFLYPLRAAWRVGTGRGRGPLDAIRGFSPDIVHIHNLFPNFGRRWVYDLDVPVVHTLHNYRPLCSNGLLFRDGHVCTDCPDGKRWSGVRHACFRSSRLATLPLAIANRKGPMHDPLIRRADRLIVLSERQRRLFATAGVPEEKMEVCPNFLPDELDPGPSKVRDREGWIFVGRLSQEKEILRLVKCWPAHHHLRVVGDGEQQAAVLAEASGKSIDLLGQIGRNEVLELMGGSLGLVFPSACYEAFPLVYLEALAVGVPTLAFEPNIAADLVRRDATGWAATWGDDLSTLLARGAVEAATLRDQCRRVFERIGTSSAYGKRVATLYREMLRRGR